MNQRPRPIDEIVLPSNSGHSELGFRFESALNRESDRCWYVTITARQLLWHREALDEQEQRAVTLTLTSAILRERSLEEWADKLQLWLAGAITEFEVSLAPQGPLTDPEIPIERSLASRNRSPLRFELRQSGRLISTVDKPACILHYESAGLACRIEQVVDQSCLRLFREELLTFLQATDH